MTHQKILLIAAREAVEILIAGLDEQEAVDVLERAIEKVEG